MTKSNIGQLKIVGTRITKQKAGIAVYWETTFEDENGQRFTSNKSSFIFDLISTEKENVNTHRS